MTATEPPSAQAQAPFPDGSVEVGVYATQAEGLEHSLVVLAMGEACWLVPTDDGFHLRVPPAIHTVSQQQLAYFDRERVGWPPPVAVDALPTRRQAPLSPLFWVLGVFAAYWAQERWPGFTEAGWLDAQRVFAHGEWWRAASALWLHGDLSHLVGNAGGGVLMFSAVIATFGFRAGWSWLAGSAIIGNLAAVAIHHRDEYRSLGASTAIFAGLGLLSGRALRVVARSGPSRRWRPLLVPLATGLAMLGLFGTAGPNTDLLAHATGFGSGLIGGVIAGGSAQRV